jgi:hypothetical protein
MAVSVAFGKYPRPDPQDEGAVMVEEGDAKGDVGGAVVEGDVTTSSMVWISLISHVISRNRNLPTWDLMDVGKSTGVARN